MKKKNKKKKDETRRGGPQAASIEVVEGWGYGSHFYLIQYTLPHSYEHILFALGGNSNE